MVRIFGNNKITITHSAARNYFWMILCGGIILFLASRLWIARMQSDADTIVRKHTDYSVIIIIFGMVILLLRVMEFNIRKRLITIEIENNILHLNGKALFPVNEIVSMELKQYSPWWTRNQYYKIYLFSGLKGELILEKEFKKTAKEVLMHLHDMLQVPWIETF